MNGKSAAGSEFLFTQYAHFGFKVYAVFFKNNRLNMFDQVQNILGGGVSGIDDEAGMQRADLRAAYGEAFEAGTTDHVQHQSLGIVICMMSQGEAMDLFLFRKLRKPSVSFFASKLFHRLTASRMKRRQIAKGCVKRYSQGAAQRFAKPLISEGLFAADPVIEVAGR